MAAVGECSLPAPWRPVSLTHVEYPAGFQRRAAVVPAFLCFDDSGQQLTHILVASTCEVQADLFLLFVSLGDFSGQLLAYLSLGPIFIIVGFVTLIIFKRELHTISFLGGLAFNEGVNWLIKNVIREPRPCEEAHSTVTTKYGMPSSHSQFMWFFSVYSFLFLYLRTWVSPVEHHTYSCLNACLVTFLFPCRVYLLYHTWSQVLYGGVAGSVMAIAWFAFTQEILTPLFPRIAAWPISEFFLIRDTSLIPNILWFEYTVTRAEARNRQRKLGTKLQ
ncbi:hypothetical protein ASZ78_009599 [Callipepla squamata]|uniref:Dolichyldiphosphatase n=1 Tax=Callipepla squamata TaxID=9009 RepID=A0A226NMX5_CALSU|nr:hypothetical protein ASZ78_009599 [Callipepla squamata]